MEKHIYEKIRAGLKHNIAILQPYSYITRDANTSCIATESKPSVSLLLAALLVPTLLLVQIENDTAALTAFYGDGTSLLIHRKIFQIHRTICFNSDSEISMNKCSFKCFTTYYILAFVKNLPKFPLLTKNLFLDTLLAYQTI